MRPIYGYIASIIALAGGYLLGSQERPMPIDSELATAQVLSGDRDVRLIGFQCGDHNLTAVARFEDEFPESGCKEIRILRDDVEFPAPPPRSTGRI